MNADYFRIAAGNITKKGMRSWLTMLGIFVGIAAVVSLISLGQGMEDAIKDQFAQMGTDIVMVMPGSGLESYGQGKLSEHDEDIVNKARGVEQNAPMISKISKVEYDKQIVYTFVSGFPVDDRYEVIENMQSFKIKEGRKFTSSDKYKAGVGILFTTGDVFDNKKLKTGDKIMIDDIEFRISSVYESFGNEQDDSSLFIPLETAEEIYNTKEYDVFVVKVKGGFTPDAVAEDIRELMRDDRNQKEGEEDFNVQTAEQMIESFGSILSAVQAVVVGIAMISLMVGGIGIMNAMYTSVIERTQEIGVMKAIGAKNKDIMMMFLIESGMLGLVGGLIGVLIGLSMSLSVEYYAVHFLNQSFLKANTSPYLIGGALLFSFVVGCISGVLPALQASKLRPVEALRYE